MLAKSLVAFICVGLISGLAFGLYLIDAKDMDVLTYVDGPSISVLTEKSDFKLGETIDIRIVNSGTVLLHFTDTSFNLRVTSLFGVPIYWPSTGEMMQSLGPGEEVVFSWNLAKNSGDAVLEGIYRIHVAGSGGGKTVEDSTTVTIWK